jgi:hypothetical protein
MQFSPAFYYFIPLRTRYSPSTLFSDSLSLYLSLNVRDQVSHPYKIKGKIAILYILMFKYLDGR